MEKKTGDTMVFMGYYETVFEEKCIANVANAQWMHPEGRVTSNLIGLPFN
jgi:hypothetical protein